MKNYLLLSVLFFTVFCHSQTVLKVESDYWSGVSIYQNGTKISVSKAMEIAKNNQKVVEKFASAKTNRTIGSIMSLPGAFAFGYTLGTAFNKNVKTNWAVGGIGGAFMIGGALLQGKGNRQLKEAVTEFNTASKTVSYFQPKFFMTCNENGIGIVTRF